ncbi:hypothetical protein DNU06_01435 [Putridiphycobacter roseus]|uniref:OmpH family outer membrane protein n=1 Tax=Putridiphycobacter roseus TaxID=2219161 RepID=A0A2W1NHE7_9FLAO|nr:OmpH family outer membrane protein [Putridiphycobacter roseus]PZE18523.1 hypothetical protein DNU06_01435 [Putridiphycobacter roseus]
MKKIFLAFTFLIGLTTAFAQSNLKFAHVDYANVVDSLPSKLAADKEMKTFIDDSQKTLQELQTLLERDYEIYMAAKDSLSAISKEIKERKLTEQQMDLQRKQERTQQDLETYNERLYTPIEKSFKKAVKTVSQKYKLNYVFETGSLLYLEGGMDISAEVKTEIIRLEKIRLGEG